MTYPHTLYPVLRTDLPFFEVANCDHEDTPEDQRRRYVDIQDRDPRKKFTDDWEEVTAIDIEGRPLRIYVRATSCGLDCKCAAEYTLTPELVKDE